MAQATHTLQLFPGDTLDPCFLPSAHRRKIQSSFFGDAAEKSRFFPNKERRWFLAPPPGGIIYSQKVWTLLGGRLTSHC